jgi:hypothetical protein
MDELTTNLLYDVAYFLKSTFAFEFGSTNHIPSQVPIRFFSNTL